MSARVTLDKLLTHIVSLPRFDGHTSTYGALTKVFTFTLPMHVHASPLPFALVFVFCSKKSLKLPAFYNGTTTSGPLHGLDSHALLTIECELMNTVKYDDLIDSFATCPGFACDIGRGTSFSLYCIANSIKREILCNLN
jgi:hypothetical protein